MIVKSAANAVEELSCNLAKPLEKIVTTWKPCGRLWRNKPEGHGEIYKRKVRSLQSFVACEFAFGLGQLCLSAEYVRFVPAKGSGRKCDFIFSWLPNKHDSECLKLYFSETNTFMHYFFGFACQNEKHKCEFLELRRFINLTGSSFMDCANSSKTNVLSRKFVNFAPETPDHLNDPWERKYTFLNFTKFYFAF